MARWLGHYESRSSVGGMDLHAAPQRTTALSRNIPCAYSTILLEDAHAFVQMRHYWNTCMIGYKELAYHC